jgi:hypothetical protein
MGLLEIREGTPGSASHLNHSRSRNYRDTNETSNEQPPRLLGRTACLAARFAARSWFGQYGSMSKSGDGNVASYSFVLHPINFPSPCTYG